MVQIFLSKSHLMMSAQICNQLEMTSLSAMPEREHTLLTSKRAMTATTKSRIQ